MAELIVLGAGGFGRETLDVIERHNGTTQEPHTVLGVADDNPSLINLERLAQRRYAYLGSIDQATAAHPSANYVVGIGNPRTRAALVARMDQARRHALSVIHPAANIGSMVQIDDGCVICAGVHVSTNVRLGRHVHLNAGATIGHDAQIEDFVSVNPGAIVSGSVTLASETLIGAGATILQGLRIMAGATVGASACVTRSVEGGTTVIGIPARPFHKVTEAP